MPSTLARIADRMLAVVAPRVEASASCKYAWYACYCSGGLRYRKKCMIGCNQVPNHCYPCEVTGTC
jgi:hypothetical protein